MLRPVAMLTLALSTSACFMTGSAEHFRRTALPRAAFDLDCPEAQLQAADLGGSGSVGVSGCGKKAVYVFAAGAGWVNNTDGGKKR